MKRTAAQAAQRLEDSRLYQQREAEARLSAQTARLAAAWYLDPQFRERYMALEAQR